MRDEDISEEEGKVIEIFDRATSESDKIDKIIQGLPNDKPLFSFNMEAVSNVVPKSTKIALYRKQQETIRENALKEVNQILKGCIPSTRDKIFARVNQFEYPDKKLDLSKEQDKAMQALKRRIDKDRD